MPLYDERNSPEQNLEILGGNEYPGRLLVAGFAGEVAVQAYAVEGRSPGSQNRILVEDNGEVYTELSDKTQPVGDPELTLYNAMHSDGSIHVVSNGRQTDTAVSHMRSGGTFEDAMRQHTFEPVAPNFTPRISAYIDMDPKEDEPSLDISVIRKVAVSVSLPIRNLYTYNLSDLDTENGIGYAVHTYKSNAAHGKPLPSFDMPPFKVPVLGNAVGMANLLNDNLHPDNLVAIAAKTVTPDGEVEVHIINKHQPS